MSEREERVLQVYEQSVIGYQEDLREWQGTLQEDLAEKHSILSGDIRAQQEIDERIAKDKEIIASTQRLLDRAREDLIDLRNDLRQGRG